MTTDHASEWETKKHGPSFTHTHTHTHCPVNATPPPVHSDKGLFVNICRFNSSMKVFV